MRKEDERASAKGCLGWKGRSKRPAISTTAVATEGSLVKAAQPSPVFLQLNGFPQTQAELRKAPTQVKVKGEGALKERGRGGGLQEGRTMLPTQHAATKSKSVARREERTSTIIFEAIPQMFPKSFLNKYPKYPTAASQRSASRPGCLPLPPRSMCSAGRSSSGPGYTAVLRPLCSSQHLLAY